MHVHNFHKLNWMQLEEYFMKTACSPSLTKNVWLTWNQSVHYCIHKSQLLDPILSQINPNIFKTYFFMANFLSSYPVHRPQIGVFNSPTENLYMLCYAMGWCAISNCWHHIWGVVCYPTPAAITSCTPWCGRLGCVNHPRKQCPLKGASMY
jgi:hypothetical protein